MGIGDPSGHRGEKGVQQLAMLGPGRCPLGLLFKTVQAGLTEGKGIGVSEFTF